MFSRRKQSSKRPRAKWQRVIRTSFVVAALVAISGAVYVQTQGHAPKHHVATTDPQGTTQTAAISTQNIRFLEQAINSGTVDGQRSALVPELRASLTSPMFPTYVNGVRTNLKIDAPSFQPDTDNPSVATVHATLSNNQGEYTLRLIREQHTWLIVYTTEVHQ